MKKVSTAITVFMQCLYLCIVHFLLRKLARYGVETSHRALPRAPPPLAFRLCIFPVWFIKTHANKHNKNTSSLLEYLVQTCRAAATTKTITRSVQLTVLRGHHHNIEHTQRTPGTSKHVTHSAGAQAVALAVAEAGAKAGTAAWLNVCLSVALRIWRSIFAQLPLKINQ